jgi:subtilisin-like proprotein convertase family protein
MRSEWVFRSLARRWFGSSSRRRGVRRPHRRSQAPGRPNPLRVEELEDRTLLSVLPAAVTTGHPDVSLNSTTATSNENTPSVTYDPLDPQKMVAVWSQDFGAYSEVHMAFSANGGTSWSAFQDAQNIDGAIAPDKNIPDPTKTAANAVGLLYNYSIDPTVAFDRAHFFYVSLEETNSTSLLPGGVNGEGAITLQKFDFSQGVPTPITFSSGGTSQIVYEWITQNAAMNPTLAVDSNLPALVTNPTNPNGPKASFIDPVTGATQTDPLANAVINPSTGLPDPGHDQLYVSWNQVDKQPTLPAPPSYANFNPDVVLIAASSDGGNDFTTSKHLNNGINLGSDRDSNPVLAISQGTSSDRASTQLLNIKSILVSGTTVTVVTQQALPFWLTTGSQVIIQGVTPIQFDGTYVISINNQIPNTFTYQLASPATGQPSGPNATVRPVVGGSGGQVTAVYDNFAQNQLVSNQVVDGGVAADYNGSLVGNCDGSSDVCYAISVNGVVIPVTTSFPLDLSKLVKPNNFNVIDDINVSIGFVTPHLSWDRIDLIDPQGNDNVLMYNHITSTGATIPTQGVLDSSNSAACGLGSMCPFGLLGPIYDVPTVFDDFANLNIHDPAKAPTPALTAPYTGHFQPEPDDTFPSILTLQGYNGLKLTDPKINGLWQLEITVFQPANPPPPQFLLSWTLNFTSGLTPQADQVAVKSGVLTGAPYAPFPDKAVPAEPDRGVGPSPSLAVDNTLGSFSPYQGRLYLAYTGGSGSSTDVYLVSSDNGGLSWSQPVKLDDDSAASNFTEGNRAKFMPQVAVDPVTGTLVASWYDARYDPANARVATYMTTSIDGGQTFSTNTFLNAPRQAIDDASYDSTTGGHATITLEPIPDNQSADNAARDTQFAFGDHEALTVYDGHVHALWSGNEDGGPRLSSFDPNQVLFSTGALDILTSDTTIGVGPRITSSTMGPVTDKQVTTDDGRTINFNNTYAPETANDAGTQQVDGFVVTFDRPVDVSTFTTNEVTVLYRDTQTQANNTAPYYGATPVDPTSYKVTPLDGYVTRYGPAAVGGINPATGLPFLSTLFLVTFAPQDGTGTYSYSVGPDIRDAIRQSGVPVVLGSPINPPAPHATDTPISIPPDAGQGDTGGPNSPHTRSTITLSGYDPKLVITHIAVSVRLNHTADSDLVIKLIGPNGVTAATLAQNTGNGQDFGTTNMDGTYNYTVFDDLAPFSINFATPPFVGTFQPQTALAVFNGFAINGNWTLDIADTAQGDTGTLLDWTMSIDAGFPTTQTGLGNFMDQNADAVTVATITPPGAPDPADIYAAPRPLSGVPFQLPYDPLTLPLSVPGPHLVGSFVPGVNAQGRPVNPPTPDNLVLNGAVNAIDVVFDRDMNPATFTTAALLRLVGPIGAISLFDATGQPLPGVYVKPDPNPQYPRLIDGVTTSAPDPDPNFPRTFQIGLPTRSGAPAGTVGQDLSGTYNLTLAASIQAKNGDAIDNNLNAGFAVLNGSDPTSTDLVAGGVSHDSGPIAVNVKPGTTIFTPITFPEGFQIQHTQVLLNITTPNSQDLTGYLVAPNGTTKILLFSDAGGTPRPGQQTGFINTTLDDRGASPIDPDSSGNGPAQPFRGIFSPAQPLSTLDGLSSAGTWQLEIVNTSSDPSHTATITEWRLTFDEKQLGTGLGEPVADQSDVHFRIFTMDPSNPLSSTTWTAVGPASINSGGNSGRIGGIAVDPSDPSGNTVYVAGASGGVWKTTNFLTTDPAGPTYVPLTDFGPTFAINVGGIAVFGQNNDPNQSVIFVATGEGDTGSTGVGFLRSMDGGATWALLDSMDNVDSSGNLLPLNQRTHDFVGTTAFKIIVDPIRSPSGQIVVFAALSGTNGGIWRSTDSGNTWQQVLAGDATDVTLAPYSAFDANNPNAPPGNAQVIYAAIRGQGVYISASEGNAGTWTLMAGQQGGNPLLRLFTGQGISANIFGTPNGAYGRIVLATPALTGNLVPGQPYTGNRARDLIYENWLYALVITPNNALQGLYLTKDRGNNWTQIKMPYNGNEANGVVVPTNNESKPGFDPFSNGTVAQGNYDVSLEIDPNNPNVIYIGGTADAAPWALTRVDTTGVFDPYAVVPYDDSNFDTGTMQGNPAQVMAARVDFADRYTTDGLVVTDPTTGNVYVAPYLNAERDPNNVFLNNATLNAYGVVPASAGIGFTNNGENIATWGPFGGAGGTDHHRVVALRDPLTGKTRLIFGDDQGIWTSIDPGDGTVLTNLGAVPAVSDPGVALPSGVTAGDRSGNLQITQFYYGTVQPSILAAQIGQALFYANAQDDGFPVSDPNILTDGNLNWNGPEGDGSGIASDRTGSGSVYTYQWPCCGTHAQLTDFFSVNPNGTFDPTTGAFPSRTTGLVEVNGSGRPPDPQWPVNSFGYGSDIVNSNVVVNPTNGDDLLISSVAGRIFRTGDQGVQWTAVGFPPGDPRTTPGNYLDGTYAPALAFGPVDPMDPSARPDLNTLWVGTVGGHAYVTLDGGGTWTNISSGLDGSPVVDIQVDPTQGTHEAYAVTLSGVFVTSFDVSWSVNGIPSIVGAPVWTPITGNLYKITHNAFNNPLLNEPYQQDPAGNPTFTEGGGLTSLAVDWRYVIPNDPNNPTGPTHPALYVGGEAGVFRSLDNGTTWTIFPSVAQDGAPVDGGYLPMAHITSLQLSTGNLNPASGVADQPTGPNLLYATTYGRGTFAIRLPLSSPYNKVLGPSIISAEATSATNTVLPNPVNQAVGLDNVNLVFGSTIDASTFTLDSLQDAQVQSISVSGSTATVTTAAPHGYTTGTRLTISGATDPAYNGLFTITVTGPSSFTYQLAATPAGPASGTITASPLHDLQLVGPQVVSITRSDPNNPNTATITMPGPHGYKVGDLVQISGADQGAYDGLFTVTGVGSGPNPTTFTITVSGNPASPATGTVTVLRALQATVVSITNDGTNATVTTSGPTDFAVGDRAIISGADQTGYDGPVTIDAILSPTQFTYAILPGVPSPATGTNITADELPIRQLTNLTSASATFGVVSITRVGTTATVTTAGPNGYVTGDMVTISGANQTGYNGTFDIVVTGPNTFTYTVPSTLPAIATGTITAIKASGPSANNLWGVSLVHQTAYGNYTLRVGPNITDYAGHPMDQDGDDNGGGGNPDDAFVKTFTIAGLQVLGVVTPPTAGPVLSIAQANGTATATTAGAHGLRTGDRVTIAGATPAGFDGDFTVTVTGPNTFTYAVPASLPASASGTITESSAVPTPPGLSSVVVEFNTKVDPASFTGADVQLVGPTGKTIPVASVQDVSAAVAAEAVLSITQTSGVATVNTSGAHGLRTGDVVTIQGASPGGFDGTFSITVTGPDTFTYAVAASLPASASGTITATPAPYATDPVLSIAQANGTATVTTARAHGLFTGDVVTIAGASVAGFDGSFNVVVTGPDTFTYAVPASLPASATGALTATPAELRQDFWQLVVQTPQLTPGLYTLTVGPSISDTGDGQGNNELLMDQNENGVYAESSVAPAGDQFQTQFSIDGLRVLSVAPSLASPVLEPPGLSSATVTFNREVNPASFTPSEVSLTNPAGVAIPVTLRDITTGSPNLHNIWELDFTAQTTPGIYTMIVGPGITDSTGTPMDQNRNFVFGQPGVAPTGDSYEAQFDVDGLAVLSSTPASLVPLPVGQDSITLTFNQAVLTGTLNANTVTLTGPQGNVPLTSFTDLTLGNTNTHTVWGIDFGKQNAYGTYTLTVDPGVEDLAGNSMNQNHNAVYGEPGPAPTGDAYQATFAIDGLQVSSISPSPANPVLSLQGGLGSMTVTFNMQVDPASFTTSNVQLTGPDGSAIPFLLQDITTGSPDLHNVWTIAPSNGPEVKAGVYTLVVGPNINDAGSNAMDQNENGVHGEPYVSVANPGDAYVAQFDVDGLAVTSVNPTNRQLLVTGQSSMTVTFNQAVLAPSMNPADVTLSGPAGNVPLTGFKDLTVGGTNAHNVWEIDFAPQTTPGMYTLTVGPGVEDVAGHAMNQNGNTLFGEPGVAPVGDAYQTSFIIDALRVVGIAPDPTQPYLEPPGLRSTTITFNREVNPLTITGQVTLIGPLGKIPVTLVDVTPTGAPFAHSVWQVSFAAQSRPGVYTLTVGPTIADADPLGTLMDQDEDQGPYGQADDAYTAQFDIDGLAVTGFGPTSPVPLPVGQSSATVTFNQGVLARSMNSTNVKLVGPGGVSIPLTSFTDITTGTPDLHNVWKIGFGQLTAYGTYTLTVGPGVEDLAGNSMNQNHNEVYGEATDAFQGSFAIGGLEVVSITPATTAPVLEPPGLSSVVVTFNMAVDPTTVTTGEVAVRRPDGSSITPIKLTDVTAGTPNALHNIWELDFAAQTTPGVYTVTVGPNISDTGNHPMDQNQNGIFGENPGDQYVAKLSVDGLAVTTVSPSGPTPQAPGRTDVTVTFNQAVLPSSLTLTSGTVTLVGPDGKTVPFTKIADISTGSPNPHNVWDLTVLPLTIPGTYTLTVGPGVEDVAGNPMNQNHNGTFGEPGVAPAGDAYQTTFIIDGLHVASVSPSLSAPVLEPPGLSSVTITFNRDVNPATFDTTKVKLTAPGGTVIGGLALTDITTATPDLHNVWRLDFPAQTTPGIYTLTVGPNVADGDPTGALMDQDEDQGPYGQADDAYTAQFDVDGLAVVSNSLTSAVPLPVGQKSVTLTFNQGVLAATMNSANVTLTGPGGASIPLSAFTDLTGPNGNHTQWEVDFPAQNTYGTYTLTVGPGVEDLAGNQMNQNHNAVYGEAGVAPTGDAYHATFALDGLQVTSVTPASTVPVLGAQGLSSATITFNMAVDPTSFLPSDLTLTAPGGTVIGGLALTDISGNSLHNVWKVTFPTQSKSGVYTLVVGPNVNDTGGNALDQNETGTHGGAGDQYQALFDVDGLAVTSVLVGPNGNPAGPTPLPPNIGAVTVTFNQAVLASTMTAANLTLTDPLGNVVPLTGFKDLTVGGTNAHDQWEIDFAGQTTPGKYTLLVGPGLEDLAGNAMNQNHNFTFGEPGVAPAGDAYQTSFLIEGLIVQSVVPSPSKPVPAATGLSSVTITFNRPVDPTTFDTSEVQLKRYDGAILPITKLTDITNITFGAVPDSATVWEVDFPTQTVPGVYTLVVGPNIADQDPTHATIDQDQDQAYGEVPNDEFVGQFDVAGLQVTSVTPAPGGTAPAGLSALVVTFNQGVLKGSLGANTVTLVGPGGTALPLVAFRDVSSGVPNLHNKWEIDFNPLNNYGTYTLTVGPGVQDLAGNPMNQNGNGIFGEPGAAPTGDAFSTAFRIDGLKVVSATPATPVTTLSSAVLTFNMAVNPTTFLASNVVLTAPDGTTIPVTVTDLTAGTTNAHNVWEVDFAPQTAQGTYNLTVVPNLLDMAGHAMDQNGNGIFGEIPADEFTAQLVVGQPSSGGGGGGGGGGGSTGGTGGTVPSSPITGLEITGLVQILGGRLRKRGKHWIQQVQIFNTSNFQIQGPFVLIVEGLPRKIHLFSASGFTGGLHSAPGEPYQMVLFTADQLNSLQGGTFTLIYTSRTGRRPRPSFRLLAGILNP